MTALGVRSFPGTVPSSDVLERASYTEPSHHLTERHGIQQWALVRAYVECQTARVHQASANEWARHHLENSIDHVLHERPRMISSPYGVLSKLESLVYRILMFSPIISHGPSKNRRNSCGSRKFLRYWKQGSANKLNKVGDRNDFILTPPCIQCPYAITVHPTCETRLRISLASKDTHVAHTV